MPVSQNGYPANDVGLTSVRTIPGTEREIRVRTGPAGDLLLWVAAQFDKRVEDIEAGQLDDWGYAERPIRGGTQLSNHASGTAIDLNAPKHGLGAVGTFSRDQVKTIHTILGEAGYCIRWGGDYSGRKDEMHFEVVASEAACRKVLAKLEAKTGSEDMAEVLQWLKREFRDFKVKRGSKVVTYSHRQAVFAGVHAHGQAEANAKALKAIAAGVKAVATEVKAGNKATADALAAVDKAVAELPVAVEEELNDGDVGIPTPPAS